LGSIRLTKPLARKLNGEWNNHRKQPFAQGWPTFVKFLVGASSVKIYRFKSFVPSHICNQFL
jgi:hypothetical protein